MDIGVEEIVLVLVGFLLAQVPLWADPRRRMRSHWAALRAEILLCRDHAKTLLHDGYMAPCTDCLRLRLKRRSHSSWSKATLRKKSPCT